MVINKFPWRRLDKCKLLGLIRVETRWSRLKVRSNGYFPAKSFCVIINKCTQEPSHILVNYLKSSVATPPRTSIANGTDTGGSTGDMATLAQRLNMDTGACAC